MKKISLASVLLMSVVLILSSCKKEPLNNLSDEESRIYITNYDTTANFNSYKSFSVSDSVAFIQDNQLAGKSVDQFDTTVMNAVKNAMIKKGYTLVDKANNPDLGIDISKVVNTYTAVFSYPDYFGYYGDYWDPYYWGYPGYGYYSPYAIGVYNIQQGGLAIDIFDLKNAAANGNKLKAVWDGLARGEGVFNVANATGEVNALFDQSPYLGVTN